MQTVTIRPEGEIGRRLKAVTNQWILPAPYANPAMLSWLPVRFDRIPAVEFSGGNPLRSFRV